MTDPPTTSLVPALLDAATAVLGIAGAYVTTRRYTPFLLFLLLPLAVPVLAIVRRQQYILEYFQHRAEANADVPMDMRRILTGLSLVCWAFVLQLVKVLIG